MPLLCISATFLNESYHGKEWPPSPARLFQAMLAGLMTGHYRALRPAAEPALRWLERQPPPEIFACERRAGRAYRLAVPNNDMDVVARAWAAGREADPTRLKTMKDVSPHLLNEAETPQVKYVWQVGEDDAEGKQVLEKLRPLTHCLHTLGWGVDMSYADAQVVERIDAGGLIRWVPVAWSDAQLAVPVRGFLDDLEGAYQRFRRRATGAGADADTRPGRFRMQAYAPAHRAAGLYLVLALQALEEERYHSENWESTVVVAGRMRNAAASALRVEESDDSFVQAFVEGHGDEKNFRMSFVPLPSIGHEHADGRIRRVMFVEPRASDGTTLRLLSATLPGRAAVDEATGAPVCRFADVPDRKVTRFYVGEPGRTWRTVTPVVLHGFNGEKGRISLNKTERLLRRAFEMAGYDWEMIEHIRFQAAPYWPNTGAAFKIRLPRHLKHLPRYHVEVRFQTEVYGPVLAGVGRHSGLGVFAKAWNEKG
jgi:CRISPR-associated protein Csb2